jgi:Flp pilus assembly protein TadG
MAFRRPLGHAGVSPADAGWQRMFLRLARQAQKFVDRRDGAVAIQMGFVLTAMLGMAALAIEIGFVNFKQRQMQSVADAAVLGAQAALLKGQDFRLEADADAPARALSMAPMA